MKVKSGRKRQKKQKRGNGLEFKGKDRMKKQPWRPGEFFHIIVHGNKGTRVFNDKEYVLQSIKKVRHYLGNLGTFHALTIGQSQLQMVIRFHDALDLIEWVTNAHLHEDTVTLKMKVMVEEMKPGDENNIARMLISRSFQRFGISLGRSFNIRMDDHGHVIERQPKKSRLTTHKAIKSAILQTHRSADLTCEHTMLTSAGLYGIGKEPHNIRYGAARNEKGIIPPEYEPVPQVENPVAPNSLKSRKNKKLEDPAPAGGEQQEKTESKSPKKIQLEDKWVGISAVEHIKAMIQPYSDKEEKASKWHLSCWKASAYIHQILSGKIRQEKRRKKKLLRRQHCIPLCEKVEQVYSLAMGELPQMGIMAKIIVFCTLY